MLASLALGANKKKKLVDEKKNMLFLLLCGRKTSKKAVHL